MRNFILSAIATFALLIAAPAIASPVIWQADGIVESAQLFVSAEKSLCRLPDGSTIAGLERVELDVRDALDFEPPATTLVCLQAAACDCAAAIQAGTHINARGVVKNGELVLSEVDIR